MYLNMRGLLKSRFFAIALLVVLSETLALGQIDTGSIVGSVSDASGAAIPKAAVTVTNVATNTTQTTTSNASGEYQFNALHPGTYTVKAAVTGFNAQEFSGIVIRCSRAL